MSRLTTLLLGFVIAAAPALGAQSAPELPRASRGADPNDWQTWFAAGMHSFDIRDARQCLEWAHRLNPARPEPVYGMWMAGKEREDSLHLLSLLLDPFMYHARVQRIAMPSRGPRTNDSDAGWDALIAGDYHDAAVDFRAWTAQHPDALDEHWGLSIAAYYQSDFDTSAVHLRTLEDRLAQRARESRERTYRSTEFIAYMEATAWVFARKPDSARAALGRALEQSLSFYHAHALLGDIALAAGDTAGAMGEWEQARELFGRDAVTRRRYALFLYRTHRPADAERELRAVLAAEPEWRDAQVDLASVIEAQGDARRADAVALYEAWLARAPRSQAGTRAAVEARLAKLRGG